MGKVQRKAEWLARLSEPHVQIGGLVALGVILMAWRDHLLDPPSRCRSKPPAAGLVSRACGVHRAGAIDLEDCSRMIHTRPARSCLDDPWVLHDILGVDDVKERHVLLNADGA